ncbi:MAG: hypothetical protein ACKO7B_04925, partial [Flavobacteriales bacterium]
PAAYTLEVMDRQGKTQRIDLLLKPATKAVEDEFGKVIPFDLSYYWGRTQDGEISMAQSFNFSPLLNPIGKFAPVY